jgi:CspA family cold shock protein
LISAVPFLNHRARAGHTRQTRPATPGSGTTKENATMPKGTVKWFNTTKGYGFIAPADGGKDIFVHVSAVEQAGMTGLADNQQVEFDLIEGRDGRKMAGNLRKG